MVSKKPTGLGSVPFQSLYCLFRSIRATGGVTGDPHSSAVLAFSLSRQEAHAELSVPGRQAGCVSQWEA